MGYGKNLLMSIDKLGNAIAGGSHTSTISARFGYFSENPKKTIVSRLYWKGLEILINFSFQPLDGNNHCHQAYAKEGGNLFNDTGNDSLRFILSFIIVVSCIFFIIPTVYIAKFFLGLKPEPDLVHIVFEQRLESTNRQLINIKHIFEDNKKQNVPKELLTKKAVELAEEVKIRIDQIVVLEKG